jgi:hypothetical protein
VLIITCSGTLILATLSDLIRPTRVLFCSFKDFLSVVPFTLKAVIVGRSAEQYFDVNCVTVSVKIEKNEENNDENFIS